jgi:hypothetical protein
MTKSEKEAGDEGQKIVNGGFVIKSGEGIANKATEHKNPVIAAMARRQLAALTATVSSAGILNPETGQLTPLGYSLKQGDDGAWAAYTAQDVTADKTAAQSRAIAVMAAVALGLITAPAWLPAVALTSPIAAGLTSKAAISAAATKNGLAATLGLTGMATAVGASADDPDSETTDTSSFWGDPDSVFKKEQDWGYEPEINRLIDKVQDIGDKILYGDPTKQEERQIEKRNILRLIKHMQKAQKEAALQAVVDKERAERKAWLKAFNDGTLPEPERDGDTVITDFPSDDPARDKLISAMPSSQVNSEITRISTEMNAPGITRKKFKELDKILSALQKQKRKNRRSNESLDRVSRARQLRS